MSGWGYADDVGVDATLVPTWGAAPCSSRPGSNLQKDSLFSPDDETSPDEWKGAGAGGRWGGGREDNGDTQDDGGGWGGQETFGEDNTEAVDWGRFGEIQDDETIRRVGDDANETRGDNGWGASADDEAPETSGGWVAGGGGDDEHDDPLKNQNQSNLRNKENAVTSPATTTRRTPISPPTESEVPLLSATVKRKHGWKSNWAVDGLARSKQSSVSAPEGLGAGREKEKRAKQTGKETSPWVGQKNKPRTFSDSEVSESHERDAGFDAGRGGGTNGNTKTTRPRISPDRGDHNVTVPSCDVEFSDSDDALLEQSGLTQSGVTRTTQSEAQKSAQENAQKQTEPNSPSAALRRAACLTAAVAARTPFSIGKPPAGNGLGNVESDSDDFGIAVTIARGRRGAKAARDAKPAKPKSASALTIQKTNQKTARATTTSTVDKTTTKTTHTTKTTTPYTKPGAKPTKPPPVVVRIDDFSDDGLSDDDADDVVVERDGLAGGLDHDSDHGFEMEHRLPPARVANRGRRVVSPPARQENVPAERRRSPSRTREDNVRPEGLGGPMSRLPRSAPPPLPAKWRRRLPHFTPARELRQGAFVDGEKVFIDYHGQFHGGGGAGAAGDRNGNGNGNGDGRWFRDGETNKYLADDGEVLEGRAAWRASEKRKKTTAAAGRARR